MATCMGIFFGHESSKAEAPGQSDRALADRPTRPVAVETLSARFLENLEQVGTGVSDTHVIDYVG